MPEPIEPSSDSKSYPKGEPIDGVDLIHSQFNDGQADIILYSCDHVGFRVHCIVLRSASSWFRQLLSLPQAAPSTERPSSPEVVRLQERAKVIIGLLSVVTGQALPALDSIQYVEDLLRAADKYDMQNILSIIRLAIMSPLFLDAHPIRVYGIASRWGWMPEAKLASTKTLMYDLFSPGSVKELNSVDSRYLTALMLLHHNRRKALRAGLESTEDLHISAHSLSGRCPRCDQERTPITWAQIRDIWMLVAETTPASLTLEAMLGNKKVQGALAATCWSCNQRLYNVEHVMSKLSTLLNSLPTSVTF